ncbi:MAG: ROK family protein [Coriobacteriales bacterium]|nr:ROK family protein [Coriobacteriales bacterium]
MAYGMSVDKPIDHGGLGREFRAWVLSQRPADACPHALDDDNIRIVTSAATAQVNFYPYEDGEIVEYLIERNSDGESNFFLHFELNDMARAQELFGQMAETLSDDATHQALRVLLCCTSALTTTLFASKMNEVAQAFSLDYEFEAMSIERAAEAPHEYAAVLLAPQVAYERQRMMKAHPSAVVFEIPAKVFGSYDAAGAVRLLMHALREVEAPGEASHDLKAVRDLDDNHNVLVITLFYLRDHSELGYRLYRHGRVINHGGVSKQILDYRDVDDLVATLAIHDVDVRSLDAVGIAVPGVVYNGVITLPEMSDDRGQVFNLGKALADRIGIPVFIDNNCNAAAVGCYVSQDSYESLVFFRHAFGHIAGGFGTIIDGHLLKGRYNLAGEPKYFESHFNLGMPLNEAVWSAIGLRELALDVLVTSTALVAPEAIYLAVDTIDDAEEFRAELARRLGEEYAPPVIIVNDYVERVYLGELALCLKQLRNPTYRSLGVAR